MKLHQLGFFFNQILFIAYECCQTVRTEPDASHFTVVWSIMLLECLKYKKKLTVYYWKSLCKKNSLSVC